MTSGPPAPAYASVPAWPPEFDWAYGEFSAESRWPPLVYAAATQSLAMLEMLVQDEPLADFEAAMVTQTITRRRR